MRLIITISILITLGLSSCIKDDFLDDFVEPVLRVNNKLDTIGLNQTYQFDKSYFNNVGIEESLSGVWSSSDESVISITEQGLATGVSTGSSIISVSINTAENTLSESFLVHVGSATTETSQSASGQIITTSSYILTGDFTIIEESEGIKIEFSDNYRASSSLPGLFVYLSNNPNSTSGAKEIGAVEVFSGAHSYTIDDVSINDFSHLLYFCKPFNIKVGDGIINN